MPLGFSDNQQAVLMFVSVFTASLSAQISMGGGLTSAGILAAVVAGLLAAIKELGGIKNSKPSPSAPAP